MYEGWHYIWKVLPLVLILATQKQKFLAALIYILSVIFCLPHFCLVKPRKVVFLFLVLQVT